MNKKTSSKTINSNPIYMHTINITEFLAHLNYQMTLAYIQKALPAGIPSIPFSTPSEYYTPAITPPLGKSPSLDDQ